MKVPTHIFREYDIRGVAERDLTDAVARGIGRGLATMLGAAVAPIRIAVGRDCRLSSDRLFAALVDGVNAAGADVVDVGVGPTPMLYGSVHALEADGGVSNKPIMGVENVDFVPDIGQNFCSFRLHVDIHH